MAYIPNRDFLLEVAKGNVAGHSLINKFGRNFDIDTGSIPEDVWGGGDLYTGHPTNTPETVDVYSASGNDTSAGTGMRTCRIFGLKTSTSTVYESEDIILAGATHVTSTNTWYRVNRLVGLTYGSGATNAGELTIEQTTTTSNVFAKVPAGGGQTAIACTTIPYGSTGYLVGGFMSIVRASGAAGSANCSLRVRESGGSGYRSGQLFDVSTSFPLPLNEVYGDTVFQGGDDITMRVDDVSDNNTIANGKIVILLVAD